MDGGAMNRAPLRRRPAPPVRTLFYALFYRAPSRKNPLSQEDTQESVLGVKPKRLEALRLLQRQPPLTFLAA